MPLQQLLLILWARRQVALLIFLATVAVVSVVSFVLPRQYVATASLVFDFRPDPVAGAVMPGAGLPGYLNTQADILQSDRVAIRAVKLLKLSQNPEAVDSWKEATGGKTPLENYYAQLLLAGLQVKPGKGTNVLSLTYTATDGQFAAAVANAFAQAFVDVNVELRVEPARQYASWFDDRLKVLRADLERAQAKLSAYQQQKGIVITDERLDAETSRLNALMTQLTEIEGVKATVASRQKNSGGQYSPDVMESTVIQGLRAEIAKAEARLAELDATQGRNHPQFRQAQAQVNGLKQQMAEEMRQAAGATATAGRVASQKEVELKNAVDEQKKRLLELRAERDAMAILVRDVESAQRAYDAVAQRISLSQLESQMQQSNVSILSPAIEPDEPAKPRILVNILASIVAGGLFGLGAALGLEKLDRLARTPEDLVVEGVPVLAVMQPRPRSFTLREALLAFRAWRLRRRSSPPPALTAEGA